MASGEDVEHNPFECGGPPHCERCATSVAKKFGIYNEPATDVQGELDLGQREADHKVWLSLLDPQIRREHERLQAEFARTKKWDLRFLKLAEHISTWSKDPSTQTGAVLVQGRKIVSVGFNGFPQGMPDGPELYANREEKYSRVVHCTTPNHLTLTADMRWVPLGDLKVGDTLTAFEDQVARRSGRRYTGAVVQGILFEKEPVFRIIFSNGDEIKATADHLWLLGIRSNNVRRWRRTDQLRTARRAPKHSSKIYQLLTPWKTATDFDSGWLSGLLDGEGTVTPRNYTLSYAQRPGPVLDRSIEILKKKALDFTITTKQLRMVGGLGRGDCQNVHIRGALAERLALLGSIRPLRLLSKISPEGLGRVHGVVNRIRSVEHVEPVGQEEVVKIQTSTGTMLVDGYPSHNCEVNAMIFAERSLVGCTLYTWPFASCDRCAVQMLQAGVRHFVFPALADDKKERWEASMERSKKFFAEVGATWVEVPLAELK